jgi:hypothetical protein
LNSLLVGTGVGGVAGGYIWYTKGKILTPWGWFHTNQGDDSAEEENVEETAPAEKVRRAGLRAPLTEDNNQAQTAKLNTNNQDDPKKKLSMFVGDSSPKRIGRK